MTAYDSITATPPDFLWEGRLPMGEVSIIAGMGGCGKGLLLADLAARISRGDVMPDGTPGPPAWRRRSHHARGRSERHRGIPAAGGQGRARPRP